jgi:hypothetical protein
MKDQTFTAFHRLGTILKNAGISDEGAAEIIGKATMVVTEQVLSELDSVVDDATKAEWATKPPQEQQTALEQAFQQKHGMSVSAYREQLAEKWVQEFESAT